MHPLVLLLLVTSISCGCGGPSIPTADGVTSHPRSAYQDVPYPPPAALVEVIPPRPSADAIWVDGHWQWQAGSYAWERGGWVKPPEGARLHVWNVVFRSNGEIWFAPNVWRNAKGAPLPTPPILAPANPPPSEVTGEHSTPP